METADVALVRDVIVVITVCLPRILTVFMVLPVLGPMLIPQLVRNSIAISFMPILYPLVSSQVPDTLPFTTIIAIVIKESLLGFAIGYVAAMMFWIFQGVGILIDNQRGSGMSMETEAMASTESSPMGTLFFQFIMVLFFTAGGMPLFMSGLLGSYRIWPVFGVMPSLNAGTVDYVIQLTNDMIGAIVLLSMPMLIAMFIVTLMMGLINRFAPKLNVFALSMPIKSAIAIFILILYIQQLDVLFEDGLGQFKTLFPMLTEVLR